MGGRGDTSVRRGRKSKGSSQTAAGVDIASNDDICPECQNHVTSDQKGISCDGCNQWWHSGCAKLSNQEYNILSKNTNINWVCQKCIDLKSQPTDMTKQLLTMMNSMIDKLAKIEERMSNMESNNLKEDNLEDLVSAKVQEAMEEAQEQQKRKLNLVLVNVPESSNPDREAALKEDEEKVGQLVNKITSAGSETPLPRKGFNSIRLGKRNAGTRARLLRITVDNLETKKQILKEAFRLNDPNEKDPSKKVFVNPDYTLKQREENKLLRQELKERTSKGETDLIISGKKIVKKPPPSVNNAVNNVADSADV